MLCGETPPWYSPVSLLQRPKNRNHDGEGRLLREGALTVASLREGPPGRPPAHPVVGTVCGKRIVAGRQGLVSKLRHHRRLLPKIRAAGVEGVGGLVVGRPHGGA